MCAREPKRCRAPKTCDSPRDALEKTWIEPRAASLSPPRTHLQHFGGFSSGKREPPASKGNSMCGGSSESSESASARFGVFRLLPEIAVLGALRREAPAGGRVGDEHVDLL